MISPERPRVPKPTDSNSGCPPRRILQPAAIINDSATTQRAPSTTAVPVVGPQSSVAVYRLKSALAHVDYESDRAANKTIDWRPASASARASSVPGRSRRQAPRHAPPC